MKVKRDGLSVRTRTGFYGVSQDEVEGAAVARAVPLVKALISAKNLQGRPARVDGPAKTLDVSRQTDVGRILASGGFQLGSNLTPGEYFLEAIVRDRLSGNKNTATQWVDFEIVK